MTTPEIRELTEAIRLTVEYVGNDTLPALEGWSWFDALRKYAPEVAEQFANPPKMVSGEDLPTSGVKVWPGREIAAIVYEDELPDAFDGYEGKGVTGGPVSVPDYVTAEDALKFAHGHIAIARHIEARDAAAKAKADEDAEERARGLEDLRRAINNNSTPGPFYEWAESMYDAGVRVVTA